MAHLCLRRRWDSVLSCFDMVPLSTRSIVNSHRQACLSTVGTTLVSITACVGSQKKLLPRSHRRSFASLIFTAFLFRATFGFFVGVGISPIVREPLKKTLEAPARGANELRALLSCSLLLHPIRVGLGADSSVNSTDGDYGERACANSCCA